MPALMMPCRNLSTANSPTHAHARARRNAYGDTGQGSPHRLHAARWVTGMLLAVLWSACLTGWTAVHAADRSVVGSLPAVTAAAMPQANEADAVWLSAIGNTARRTTGAPAGQQLVPWDVPGWQGYLDAFKELQRDPQNRALRMYFGLPLSGRDNVIVKFSGGRSAPRWLGWRNGSYTQAETAHFKIYSHADAATTRKVAADLERTYWIWTQVFFPLWEGRQQVSVHFKNVNPADFASGDGMKVSEHLAARRARVSSRTKLRVVLLQDAADYVKTLGDSIPGIERSTGFYSDQNRTSFFYPTETIDGQATRRHELVHQLFREATRSELTIDSPGQSSDFWIIEGIAGWFESLHIDSGVATIGGWDSPRLQFARHRIFGRQQIVPLSELRPDNMQRAQQRGDLAAFYAYAIAYTHLMMDGHSVTDRRWIYQLLTKQYKIQTDLPATPEPTMVEQRLVQFLRIDDQRVTANPITRPWVNLCFNGTQVTSTGLATIDPSNQARWLDLTGTGASNADLFRLAPQPTSVGQLSLERTTVDDQAAPWFAKAKNLTELDISNTRCGDKTVSTLAGMQALRTLWLTGSAITDRSLSVINRLPAIESIDLQRTEVSPRGLQSLKAAHPNWKINPL